MKPARPISLVFLAAAVVFAGCGDKKQAGTCRDVETPKPKQVALKNPKRELSRNEKVTAVVKTNCGVFEVALDARRAPKTGGSFTYLVEKGVYDNTLVHRIVPKFVIQGGDPKGDGTGGPGYSAHERPPADLAYTKGIVAMAKTGAEPPGTSGSQFYVVTVADAGLPPDYALLGKVSKGMDVVARIGKLGDPASGGTGTPLETVVIEKVTLRRN